jgi:AraC-like DNA-binding protein
MVHDLVCTAGPTDPVFEERHDHVCIAAVTGGSFQYRSRQGSATLAPGALLLGNESACYECGHPHGAGDRCLAFNFTPAYFEQILAATPGARRAAFPSPRLPPSSTLAPLVAAAEAADDAMALEETGLRLAHAAVASFTGGRTAPSPGRRDERRIGDALRRIETAGEEPVTLAELSRSVAMSPFHFLRVFRAVVGTTPHQFLLAQRLRRAAVQLRRTNEPVTAIAFDAGFSDLSTFNRRFRALTGSSPTSWRARRH